MIKIDHLRGPSVSISASPDDWGLYNADTPEQEQDRDFVTEALNKGMEAIIARSPTKRDVSTKELSDLLRLYSGWGSNDTEGHTAVKQILDKVYGD